MNLFFCIKQLKISDHNSAFILVVVYEKVIELFFLFFARERFLLFRHSHIPIPFSRNARCIIYIYIVILHFVCFYLQEEILK